MKSKKIICVILTALISVSLVSVSYGQDVTSSIISSNAVISSTSINNSTKFSKDEAKDIAKKTLKEYFDIDIDETKYQSNVNMRPDFAADNGSNSVWSIDWYLHTEEKNISIGVKVDANTGKVINIYNITNSPRQTQETAVISEDDAKSIGETFLKKINPNEFSQCKFIDNNDMNNGLGDHPIYNFSYCRIVNSLPFIGNYLTVGIDSLTGKVCSYGFTWSENQVAAQDAVISKDKAYQLFRDNLKLELTYIACRDAYGYESSNPTAKLVYMMDTSKGISLDAKSGNMLNYPNTDSGDKKVKDLNEQEKQSFLNSYKASDIPSKELDSSSAEAKMKQIVKDIYGEDYDIQSTNYQESINRYGSNANCWSGKFVKKNSNGFDQGQITIDESTGQLVSIDKFNPMLPDTVSNADPKLTWEQAYDKAISVIEKYFPDKIKELNTKQTYTKNIFYYNGVAKVDKQYNFYFNRLLNGIPYQDDNINICFDSETGEIRNAYSNWSINLNVPPIDGALSENNVKDIFLKKYTPELGYLLINTSKDTNKPNMEVKLVYSLLSSLQYRMFNNIDAFNGKFIDYNGQEADNNAVDFKAKIKGSTAEKELRILASQGIIDTKNFDLNEKVTRADFIKMLIKAKGYIRYRSNSASDLKIKYNGTKGDEMYRYLQAAVEYGILDNSGSFNGNEVVSREEMIKDIVKLLRYDDIAKAKDIFTLSYSDAADITPDNIGYVAVAKGLSITNDSDGKFRPKDAVTMTDAALIIYKALGRIRNN